MPSLTTHKISTDESDLFTSFAQKLAEIASRETLAYFRTNAAMENKSVSGAYDPVTLADKNAEKAIISEINAAFPDHGIFAEESGNHSGTSDYQWIIDPIDGTGAFVCGIPLWGTLISLKKKDAPVLGLIDQPFLGDRYIGLADRSILVTSEGETKLATSGCTRLAEAKLATTSPLLFSPEEKTKFESVQSKAKITRYGTDCSAYTLLASGHIDLVIEAGLNAYDICALIPLIEGAGGAVNTWQQEEATEGGQIIAAASTELMEEACSYLHD